jgi:ribosomal subunit interface protein
MQLQFNYANVESSEALEEHVRDQLKANLERFFDNLTRFEVHFADLNSTGKHGGNDKRCRIEARPRGKDPVVVDDTADDLYDAAIGAAGKLERVLEKLFRTN